MEEVTIHTYTQAWKNAEIVGTGQDTWTFEDVLIVRHPDFEYDVVFYAEPDEEGRHLNIGSAAFWITRDELEKG